MNVQQPSVQTAYNASTSTHTLEVSLTYTDEPYQQSKRKTHKLGIDVPFHDVRPPALTCSANLENVQFDIRVRRPSRRKRKRLKLDDNADIADHENHPAATESLPLFTEEPMQEFMESEEHEPVNPDASVLADPLELDLRRRQEGEESMHDEPSMLLEAYEEELPDTLTTEPTKPYLLKRASSALDIDDGEEESQKTAILELIDAAIRCAISDSPTRLAKGIAVNRKDSFQSLSGIAPALWSPGYLPAVAERAVFVPTISHALAAICSGPAKAGPLQSMTDKPANQTSEQSLAINTSQLKARSCTREMYDVWSSRVWQALGRGLYDPEAARRLKPLALHNGHLTGEPADDEELLDASQQSWEGFIPIELQDDDDFSLCLEDEVDDLGYEDDLLDSMYGDSAYAGIDHCDRLAYATGVHELEDLKADAYTGRASQSYLWQCVALSEGRPNGLMQVAAEEREEDDAVSIRDSFGALSIDEERRCGLGFSFDDVHDLHEMLYI